ncbi:MAG: translocation/assembly module TamB domain-containing protein [Balneola sp.]
MENKSSNIIKKTLKIVAGVVLCLTLILIGIRFSLKTDFVHNFAKSKIESIANESLTKNLKISTLSGDLWSEIQLTGLHVGDEDTLAYIDTVYASYDVLSYFSGVFNVDLVKVSNSKINVIESNESTDSVATFNIQEIVKPDTTDSEFSFMFEIENINIQDADISVYSPSLLPDSSLKIQNLSMSAGFAMKEEIEASVSKLNFYLKEGRLPEAIGVTASAEYNNKAITLQDLVVNSGRSLLQANAFVDLKDTTINSNLDLKPLSVQDVQPYVNQEIPSEIVTMSVQVKGSLDSLEIELSADGKYFKNIEAVAKVSFRGEPKLTQFGIKGEGLNIAGLTNDSIDVQTGLFQATMDGELTSAYEKTEITWGFTIEGIRYQEYNFRRFFGSGFLKDGKSLSNFDVTTSGEERLTINTDLENVFSDETDWNMGFTLKNFNAAYWAESEIKTDISLNGFAEGKGFELSEDKWIFGISNSRMRSTNLDQIRDWEKKMNTKLLEEIEIDDQSISYLSITGDINKDSVSVQGLTELTSSRVEFSASASSFLSDNPSFKYNISTKDFNANELAIVQDFQTSVDMEITGSGSGSNLENLSLSGSAHIDTSVVNGADIDLLNSKYEIREGILYVNDSEFRSDIANASFKGRRNIKDKEDPDNVLSLDLELKNTQPLATLIDLEILQIKGSLSADIKENADGYLQCIAEFNLKNIVIDELFLATKIDGNGEVTVKNSKDEGTFELDIIEPQITGTSFQDIKISSDLSITGDSLYGNYSLELQDTDEGQILNGGQYQVELDSMNINLMMDKLDLITKDKSLSIQESFNISVRSQVIRTDSLILTSPDGAFLSLSIPYADSLNQRIWLVGESFDFGVLQEIILDERIVDGVLFGEMNINNTQDSLRGSGNLELQNLNYDGIKADVLSLNFNADDKRIKSELAVIWESEKVISGNIDIPFDLGDPEEFSDEFYNQKVSGSLIIKPTSLDRFKSILEKFEITGTKGIISFEGSLSGTAGAPNFEGALNVENPVFSDVTLDSAYASFGYNHDKNNIFINAEVLATKQKAADIEIDLPFSYNFKTFEVNMIDENQPVSATITTKDFNLSVFNDFLDKDFTKNLKGTLNGMLTLEGTDNSLSSEGYFDLTNSSLEVPIAGIKLDGIKSRMEFSKGKIVVKELVAKSGKGEFKANGDINLDGLTPTTLDIKANANQFKLANTDEYNMVVDINSTLSGPALTPKATGRFAVKNGFIVLDNFGDKAVEEVRLEGEEAKTFSLYDSLSIEMEFEIERNFFVRNRRYLDMEIEISGELDAQKETRGELFLFGSLSGDGGYIRPLGKRFELEEAELIFSGTADNPDLNIRSAYVPTSRKGEQEVTVYYVIKGTAEDPDFTFESTPTMEKQDIICYTLFNRPCYALESWQNAFTQGSGASPTDLLAGVLIDEVEALATRELGVDVVQIDNTRVGNETGTSIKTGWYLNDRTFFAIINEITSSDPKTLFILEYALSKTWDLIITEGEDSNRRGIDVQWQFDY